MTPPGIDAPAPRRASPDPRLVVLLSLCAGFLLSNAFRTIAAVLARPLQADLGLSPQQLGLFSGSFHFAFGALQLVMGIGIDVWGIRRTILVAFVLTIAGAAVSALAPGFGWLLAGQVLIGIGCSPAFLVCTVFIARHFGAERFASVSGLVMAVGGLGMLATGTPLAWVVEAGSWRSGFAVLAVASAVAWLVMWRFTREPVADAGATPAPREPLPQLLLGFWRLLVLPHTAGILVLGGVTYAAFLSLRGLWLGPLLMERYGLGLVQGGNALLLVSLVSLAGPALLGRLDTRSPMRRRRRILVCTGLYALFFVALGLRNPLSVEVLLATTLGLMQGYIVLQYADVRAAYPAQQTGRAMAAFTMAMFLGIAVMQWFTGLVATLAAERGIEPYRAVLWAMAAVLVLAALAFARLPQPPAIADLQRN